MIDLRRYRGLVPVALGLAVFAAALNALLMRFAMPPPAWLVPTLEPARDVEVPDRAERPRRVPLVAVVADDPGAVQRCRQPRHARDHQMRRDVGVDPALVGLVEGAEMELGHGT